MSIEYSSQVLAPFQPQHEESSVKPPLAGVDLPYPDLSQFTYTPSSVTFPFSNDECSEPYFKQLSVRQHSHEYLAAQNQVALLVGESSLIANLHHIPESTIILLDISPDMCIFMQAYVNTLRTAKNIDNWLKRMDAYLPGELSGKAHNQVMTWLNSGKDHPLNNDEMFDRAQKAARAKAITSWNGDIRSNRDMEKLSETLSENNAMITFMNLTNVIPFSDARVGELGVEGWGEALRLLPTTTEMPILTTTREGFGLAQTGPFFGINNLVRSAEFTQKKPVIGSLNKLGAVTARQFAQVL
ncbi:MAG TPA: hypothetical protein VGE34_01235 [Candidatus Saccharimonadales bacterium]